jgi:putative ABC transport system permease protein
VTRRRGELALRIALGADPVRILGTTITQAAVMVGSGLALGALLSLWAARALSGVLFGTDSLDAVSIGMAAAVLVLSGAGAVFPAAWRAARTDPAAALRAE